MERLINMLSINVEVALMSTTEGSCNMIDNGNGPVINSPTDFVVVKTLSGDEYRFDVKDSITLRERHAAIPFIGEGTEPFYAIKKPSGKIAWCYRAPWMYKLQYRVLEVDAAHNQVMCSNKRSYPVASFLVLDELVKYMEQNYTMIAAIWNDTVMGWHIKW